MGVGGNGSMLLPSSIAFVYGLLVAGGQRIIDCTISAGLGWSSANRCRFNETT